MIHGCKFTIAPADALILVFSLFIAAGAEYHFSISEAARCCDAGQSNADFDNRNIRSQCANYVSEHVPNISNAGCQMLANLCCIRYQMQKLCDHLINQIINNKKDELRCNEYQECCDCCELGVHTRRNQQITGSICLPLDHILGRECNLIYRECCLSLNLSTIFQEHQCPQGYAWNSRLQECRDMDECSLQTHNCTQGYRCENTNGGFKCVRERHCGTGYTVQHETQRCVDIDECESQLHNCGPGMICENLPGTFKCLEPNCDQNGTKFDRTRGRCVRIRCPPGYQLDKEFRCRDIDECKMNESVCPSNQQCRNTIGSFECVAPIDWNASDISDKTCPDGSRFNHDEKRCEDIDECSLGLDDCHSRIKGSVCVNTMNSFECACPPGFERSAQRDECVDIDECKRYSGVCSENAYCVNTHGSYSCVCKPGFRGDRCDIDIDECEEMHPCEHICVNLKGSYFCLCRPGYLLDQSDQKSCVDINECEENLENGGQKRLCPYECANTNGSYECRCPAGYISLNNGQKCVDIDECKSNPCPLGTSCVNTFGSYRCVRNSCPAQYQPVSVNHCKLSKFARHRASRPTSYFFAHVSLHSNPPTPMSLFVVRMQVPTGMYRPQYQPSYSFRLAKSIVNAVGVQPATANDFVLATNRNNPWEVELRLIRSIQGPQDVHIDVISSFNNSYTARVHSIVRLSVYVGPYDF